MKLTKIFLLKMNLIMMIIAMIQTVQWIATIFKIINPFLIIKFLKILTIKVQKKKTINITINSNHRNK